MSDSTEVIKEPRNVALYARVSTGRQENEQTIESQLDEVKKKIQADGNILLPQNIFIDDGWSGEMIVRPSLDAMRDSAKEGRFEALYVYDRGRLSRTFAHQEIIIEELGDRDIKFISLHDVQADTPEAKVLQSMQGVFHEYERIKIIERMRRGKLYKAKNGVIINGEPLYGLKFVKSGPKEAVNCFLNEDEARTVRLIWNWFGIDRLSINEIQKKLFDLGIKPRKGKSDFWTKGPIVRILKCDSYVTGKAYYNKSESIVTKHPLKDTKYKKVKKGSRRVRPREEWIPFDVPKIINDYALYEKNQKILDFNKIYKSKLKKYNYLLSGLIYCGCGNRRCGDGCSKNGNYYYRCIERIKSNPFPTRCKNGGVNAKVVDHFVWKELKKRLSDYSLLREYAVKWLKTYNVIDSETMLEKQRLIEMIVKVDNEESRYQRAYGADTLSFEQFQQLVKDARKRKESYKLQIEDMAKNKDQTDSQITVDELVVESQKVISKFDFTNKFKAVHDIIQKVIVSERSGATVWAQLPLPVTITEKLGYEPQRGYCWFTKRREKHAF